MTRWVSQAAGLASAAVVLLLSGSGSIRPPARDRPAPVVGPHPLILQASEGERRLHRPPPGSLSNLTAPFTIKVDGKNGGAPEFFMFTEDIAPGQAIPPHRHPDADEILFIHEGTAAASVGGAETAVTTGGMIYMPRNTVIHLRNTGSGPLRIVAIFSRPGYDRYMREISVPEGVTPSPLTVAELQAIRARHRHDVVYERP